MSTSKCIIQMSTIAILHVVAASTVSKWFLFFFASEHSYLTFFVVYMILISNFAFNLFAKGFFFKIPSSLANIFL